MTTKVDFDNYAKEYDQLLQDQLSFFEDNEYFSQYKVQAVARHVLNQPKTILEYGCGTGRNLPFFTQLFPGAEIHGCDLSKKSLELAAQINPNAQFFTVGEKQFQNTFDLIFVAGVFHHIAPPLRQDVMTELYNSLKPGGELFVFEHNPYNPVTRHLVNTCEFDEDAILLKPKEMKQRLITSKFIPIKTHYTLFFPAFLNKLRFLENYLGWLPLGGQYFIHATKK